MEPTSETSSFNVGFGAVSVNSPFATWWTVPLPINYYFSGSYENDGGSSWPATDLTVQVNAYGHGGSANSPYNAIFLMIGSASADGTIYFGGSVPESPNFTGNYTMVYYPPPDTPSPFPVPIPANGYAYAVIGAVGDVTVGSINYCY
jgi:hypothetical protein